jgi:hypothetical protein
MGVDRGRENKRGYDDEMVGGYRYLRTAVQGIEVVTAFSFSFPFSSSSSSSSWGNPTTFWLNLPDSQQVFP